MNLTLVQTIRARMQAQSTEQLLDLWVTNDRATWSEEAFEAVKGILAERGVTDLPAQNGLAPIAARHVSGLDPDAAYWFGALRPLLWISVVIAVLGLAQQIVGVLDIWSYGGTVRPRGVFRTLSGVSATVLLPALLLVSAVACLRRIPVGRVLMLWFCWVALAFGAADMVLALTVPWAWTTTWGERLDTVLTSILSISHGLALPVILLFLLRRPEFKAVFRATGGSGFEPGVMRSPAASPSTRSNSSADLAPGAAEVPLPHTGSANDFPRH